MLALVGTLPSDLLISLPDICLQSFSNGLNVFIACSMRIFLSARNKIRGLRFHQVLDRLAWRSLYAIWKAMYVLPVPVARVSSILLCPLAIAVSALLIARSW